MKANTLLDNIKDKLKIAPREFYVALVIIVGCVLGFIGRQVWPVNENLNSTISADSLIYILDSLAEQEKQTYVGSNIQNEPIEELAKLDKKNYPPSTKKSDFTGVVNINTASKKDLMQLYNIGNKTAESIIEYRKHKPFRRIEDILYVKGIGAKTFEKIKNNICI